MNLKMICVSYNVSDSTLDLCKSCLSLSQLSRALYKLLLETLSGGRITSHLKHTQTDINIHIDAEIL